MECKRGEPQSDLRKKKFGSCDLVTRAHETHTNSRTHEHTSEMVKQKHHTCRNKSYKEHRQGIKKVQRNRYVNTKGMDQKFLKCRRYSKHGSAEKVKADLESSGKVAVKKMHPAVRERKKHAAESKAGEAPVWVKPQIVRAASSHRLKHRVSISDQKAVAESGRASGSVMAMVSGERSAAQLNDNLIYLSLNKAFFLFLFLLLPPRLLPLRRSVR